MSRINPFIELMEKINHTKSVICRKESVVSKSEQDYKAKALEEDDACIEKAINLNLFAIVEVLSEELETINNQLAAIDGEIDAIIKQMNDNEDTDNQEV